MTGFGKIAGVSSADYHGTDAVSHSRLEVFRKRPALYNRRFIAKTLKREENHAFDLGSAAHAMILEGPQAYYSQTALWGGGSKVINKTAWANFKTENEGKLIVDAEDHSSILEMRAACTNHPEIAELLYEGDPELTWRVQSKALPVPLQCRTDWFNARGCALTDGRPYILDIKTTPSLDDDEFRNFSDSFVRYGYHRQAGFYSALLRDLGFPEVVFFFAAVEKEPPYGVDLLRITESGIGLGLTETLHDLERLATCYGLGVWPNRARGIRLIEVPDWYTKKQALLS